MNTEVRKVLTDLVAIPSFSDNLAMTTEIIEYAAAFLCDCGMTVEIFTDNGHDSLVATSAGTKNPKHPKLLLQSHLDVVPCQLSQLELTTDSKGRYYGRGVFDMKFAAACFLVAAREFADELKNLDFGIMLTTDEETGGQYGVGYLTKQGYSADVVLLPDGGFDWKTEIAARGTWSFEVTARGAASHASRPWLGKNAIEELMQFAETAKSIVYHDDSDDATLVLSQIDGGTAMNQVPDKAVATFDMRFDIQRQGNIYRSKITEAAHEQGVEVRTQAAIETRHLDRRLPAVKAWSDTVAKICGDDRPGYSKSYGATDARYFGKDTPVIVVAPQGGGAHSDNEWIDARQLDEFYTCVVTYILKIARRSE